MTEVAECGIEYNIISDVHTRDDLLKEALSLPGMPAMLGDLVDGIGNEKETLKMARYLFDPNYPNIGAGNHETERIQVVNAAMHIKEGMAPPEFEQYVDAWVNAPRMGRYALASYSVSLRKYKTGVDRVMAMYDRMQEDKLFDFLLSLPAFLELSDYEDPANKQRGVIAIHAGMTDDPWQQQRSDLKRFTRELRMGDVGQMPPQIYSPNLARTPAGFSATKKTVVTGHVPLEMPLHQRITADGKRVRLGSPIKHVSESPLFTYNTKNREVIPVQAA